ncbi:uncharacterized protein LOC131859343 [Cryptomeria japonica]|uniref:uncharacterized protein LOC131859343 n=1 Tax=Cryptomeria japonica TaxID=3369 RepID=UPI0027DAAC9A|nr:uncharacterized protein LOC131859343 [Cryptomeria japonica]
MALERFILDRLFSSGATKTKECVESEEGFSHSQVEESVDHLLLTCEVAQKCWSKLQRKLHWQGPLQCSLKEVFKSWPKQTRKSTLSCVWKVIPSIVIWEIWKERNHRIFQDKIEDERRLLSRINRAIEEVVGSTASKSSSLSNSFSSMDRIIQKAWLGIKIRHGATSNNKRSKGRLEKVQWKPPKKGWVKVNFDGAAQQSGQLAGAGFALWDDNGYLLKYGAKRLWRSTNNEAEAQAAILGIELA